MQIVSAFRTLALAMTNHAPSDIGSSFESPDSISQHSIISPIGHPQVTKQLSENIILTTVDLYNWAKMSSLWPLLYGTACCFIEFAALIGSRFDFDRFGLLPRASPRQADLIILAGTLNMKILGKWKGRHVLQPLAFPDFELLLLTWLLYFGCSAQPLELSS